MMGGNLTISRRQEEASSSSLVVNSEDAAFFSLTDHERHLIDSTWKHLTASYSDVGDSEEELGVLVFMRIFELQPAIRDSFPLFQSLNDREAMRRNVIFRCHGLRFVRAVRSVVDNLDALAVTAVPNLDLLGRKHQGIHGFKADYLLTYETAMEDIWAETLGRKFDKSTCAAWRKVFRLITSSLLGGYERSVDTSAAAAATVDRTTAVTPNDVNGSVACNDSECEFSN